MTPVLDQNANRFKALHRLMDYLWEDCCNGGCGHPDAPASRSCCPPA